VARGDLLDGRPQQLAVAAQPLLLKVAQDEPDRRPGGGSVQLEGVQEALAA
jgi:hypothetical protein